MTAASRSPNGEIDLREYLRVLRERRLVILVTIAVVVFAVMFVTLLRTPRYDAAATLQIERLAPDITNFREVVGFDPYGYHDFYETQYQVIRSRGVLELAAASIDLENRPEYVNRRPSPLKRALAALRGGNRQTDPQERVLEFVERGLRVRPVSRSHLVEIAFLDRDRELARDLANAVADAYQVFNHGLRHQTSSRATEFLGREVARIRDEIAELETQLLEYGDEQAILSVDAGEQDISEQALAGLNVRLTEARSEVAATDARWVSVRDAQAAALPEVLASPVITHLKQEQAELERRHTQMAQRFKPGWPARIETEQELAQSRERLSLEIEELAERVRQVARLEHDQAVAELNNLERQVERQKREVLRVGHAAIAYGSLRDEIETRRTKLGELMARQSETETSQQLRDARASNVRIVEYALAPADPARPRKMLSLFVALFVGVNLGGLAAVVAHHVDNRIKDENDLTRYSGGLPVLAHVPVHEPLADADKPRPKPDLASHEDPRSMFAESFRSLRTSLLLATPEHPPRLIHITSSEPGEGKSTVASNLAIVLTQMGKRVLIVDADLRRPRLHEAFDLVNDSGLSNVLTGLAGLDEVIRRTEVPGLWMLPSGPVPPNPSELLGSQQFGAMIGELAGNADYDHILVDSPPIVQIADSVILCSRLDVSILVARAGMTSRDAVSKGVERLRQARAQIAGTLLNGVSERSGYYSYRKYYYRSRDEERKESKRRVLVLRFGRRRSGTA